MRIAPLTSFESLRLDELHSYDIVDTGAESEYDDLVELAAEIVGCPMAAISTLR